MVVKLVTAAARVVEAVLARREDISPVPMLKFVTTLDGTVTAKFTTATLAVDKVLLNVVATVAFPHTLLEVVELKKMVALLVKEILVKVVLCTA